MGLRQHARNSQPSRVQAGWYGTFWVRFSDLHAAGRALKPLDPSKLYRLMADFQTDFDCENPEHRLKGVVPVNARLPSIEKLKVRRRHRADTSSFLDWKWGPVYYRDGRHRLKAASNVLNEREHWWVVDIWVLGTLSGGTFRGAAAVIRRLPSS